MRLTAVYLVLAVIGTVLPYSAFVPFLQEHGLDVRLFLEQLFANRISAFFGWDVIVSSVVLWLFVLIEGRRLGMKRLWMPIAGSLAVGVSLGLPLFLYMREAGLAHSGPRRHEDTKQTE
jgi:hypothetical protein